MMEEVNCNSIAKYCDLFMTLTFNGIEQKAIHNSY